MPETAGTPDRTSYLYDIFISYSEADEEWVEGYLLPELGLPTERVLTASKFRLGVSTILEFERAVTQSRYVLLILTPAFLADHWTEFGDQLISYLSITEQSQRLIPLRLKPVQLPPHIAFRVALDCTDEDNWDREIGRLRALLDQPAPKPEAIPCPYPGLQPYQEEQSKYFYGREKEVEELLQRLRLHPFVTLIGPSGSGKSSLLRAGLIPVLRQSRFFSAEAWEMLVLRPGPQPLQRLAALLSQHVPQNAGTIESTLEADPAALRDYLARIGESSPADVGCLLLVDQFEEVFAQCKDLDLRQRFFEQLQQTLEAPPDGCLLVLAVRSDFYAECQESLLWPHIEANLMNLQSLSPEGLRRSIIEPAQAVGVHLEAALVERLIADAANEKGALPLLQETLVLLWERFLRRRLLTLADYEKLGQDGRSGLQVAISRQADATLAALDEEQRAIARRIFLRLVEFGEGRRDTRRQQPVEALLTESITAEDLEEVLEHLVRHSLLTADRDEESGSDVVDLAHEMLIAAWPRLRQWLDSYEAMEERRRSLVLAAVAWRENAEDPSYLFTGSRLKQIEAWAAQWTQELGTLEKEFIAASQTLAKRRRRQRLIFGAVAGVATIVLLAVLVYTGIERFQAERVRRAIGTELIPIQAGPAIIGGLGDEPERTVTLLPFAIEKYEVSNRQYRACAEYGPCEALERSPYYQDEALLDHPVVLVDAWQAHDYCTWLGRRLPTQIEWERAARGAEGREWPWGASSPQPGQVQLPLDGPLEGTVSVDSMPAGATPDEIYHLADNVAEWVVRVPQDCAGATCHQPWDGESDRMGIIGGAYRHLPFFMTEVTLSAPDNPDILFGFRCIADDVYHKK